MLIKIIIPVWGDNYLKKLDLFCLPALLSEGNLPVLASEFDCELVIATESRLFESAKNMCSIKSAESYCNVRFISIDDLISIPPHYGYTLTQAFYRGIYEFKESATNIWFLFLNADFILAEGSYYRLLEKIKSGATFICSPSYCVISEKVEHFLEEKKNSAGVLSLQKRDMASIILKHAHYTLRAKIINAQFYHIDRTDQFYWLHDINTLVGRQMPIACVALRPEVLPESPNSFWDYGLKSEMCPSASICVIGDSDDFLMLELRSNNAMSEQLCLGKMDTLEVSADLSKWTTADQRDCGRFDLVLHRENIPDNVSNSIKKLSSFYEDIFSNVTSSPRSHKNHYIWLGAEKAFHHWRERNVSSATNKTEDSKKNLDQSAPFKYIITNFIKDLVHSALLYDKHRALRSIFDLARAIYEKLFGRFPTLGPMHPEFSDLFFFKNIILGMMRKNKNIIVIQGDVTDSLLFCSLYNSSENREISKCYLKDIYNINFSNQQNQMRGLFDGAIIECNREELLEFSQTYLILQRYLNQGAEVVILYRIHESESLIHRDFALISRAFPALVSGNIQTIGGLASWLGQRLWRSAKKVGYSDKLSMIFTLPIYAVLVMICSTWANIFNNRRHSIKLKSFATGYLITIRI